MNDDIQKPVFLKVPAFAALANISTSQAYALVKRRRVPSVLLGTAIRIPCSALQQLEREALASIVSD
jgi:hypothetical protein